MAIEQARKLDAVTLEVLRNAFPAIANEMSVDLQRTSYNMMIYEVRDYCCALLDLDGRLISQNIGGVSHFVADLGVVVQDAVRQYGRDGFAPNDVLLHNHQRSTGQHLNNMCVYTPFFFEGELAAFTIVRAHWIDIGGLSTGFGAVALVSDPWMEGLQLEHVKIHEAGVPDNKVLKFLADNIRYPEASMGDLRSQLAACRLAERRLQELFARYSRDTIMAGLEQIFDETEAKCRAVVEQFADGEYAAETLYDHDYVERDKPVPLKAKVIVRGSDMTVDLTESSPQRRGAINSRTLAAPYIAYKALTGPLEPVNEGSFRALNVDIQEGNLMMARYPAPMVGWSEVLPSVVDLILKALAPAMPDKIPAAHQGAMGGGGSFFGVDPETGKHFLMQSIDGAGWGGRPYEDGPDASCTVCQGDVRNGPVETLEHKCPVIIEQRGLRPDSGGPGKYRGGLGVTVRVKGLVEGRWNLGTGGRTMCPPWGIWDGKEGVIPARFLRQPGESEFKTVELHRGWVPAGSEALIQTSGGGGWGNPLDRDPARVRWDVLEGFISLDSARDNYGVVLDPASLEMDQAATLACRGGRGQGEGSLPHG